MDNAFGSYKLDAIVLAIYLSHIIYIYNYIYEVYYIMLLE